jgi:hypothetical protein
MDGCEGGNVFDSFAGVLCRRLRGTDEASEAIGGFKVATYFILIFYLTGFYC